MAQAGQEKEAELSWRSTACQAAKKEGLGASVSYAQGAIERGTLPFLEGETGERSSHLGVHSLVKYLLFIYYIPSTFPGAGGRGWEIRVLFALAS